MFPQRIIMNKCHIDYFKGKQNNIEGEDTAKSNKQGNKKSVKGKGLIENIVNYLS